MAKIYLERLTCVATAGSGSDDTYMKLNIDGNQKIRWPKRDSKEMDRGDVAYLNMPLEFEESLTVELFEEDWGDDDFMGSHTFKATDTGSGSVTIENSKEGDEYKLKYVFPSKEVKTATLLSAKCVKVATSIDAGVLDKVMGLTSEVAKAAATVVGNIKDPKAAIIAKALEAGAAVLNDIPGLAKAIDEAGGFPDQLYLTLGNTPGISKRFWPIADYYEVRSGQIIRFDDTEFLLTSPVDINFWEYDTGSPDDHLGNFSIETDTEDGVYFETISNKVEGDIYIVSYKVGTKGNMQ